MKLSTKNCNQSLNSKHQLNIVRLIRWTNQKLITPVTVIQWLKSKQMLNSIKEKHNKNQRLIYTMYNKHNYNQTKRMIKYEQYVGVPRELQLMIHASISQWTSLRVS